MRKIVDIVCYNCKTRITVNLDEVKPGEPVWCPHCNLAQRHANLLARDKERYEREGK